jgi:hypothetical protein
MLDPTDQGFTSGRVSLTFGEPPPGLASPRLLLYLPDRGSLPKFEDLLGGGGRKQMRCGPRGPPPLPLAQVGSPLFPGNVFLMSFFKSQVFAVSPHVCSLLYDSDFPRMKAPPLPASSNFFGSRNPKSWISLATTPVHPVWWLAPRPAPLSPWKYS